MPLLGGLSSGGSSLGFTKDFARKQLKEAGSCKSHRTWELGLAVLRPAIILGPCYMLPACVRQDSQNKGD